MNEINWEDVLKKEARDKNNEEIGIVHEITDSNVLVQKGIIEKQKFLIPLSEVESFDGSHLKFKISERDIKQKYTTDDSTPSIEDQYYSTTEIDDGGGSGGGIQIEQKENNADTPRSDLN